MSVLQALPCAESFRQDRYVSQVHRDVFGEVLNNFSCTYRIEYVNEIPLILPFKEVHCIGGGRLGFMHATRPP
jgi:hypothetical protein